MLYLCWFLLTSYDDCTVGMYHINMFDYFVFTNFEYLEERTLGSLLTSCHKRTLLEDLILKYLM